MNSWRVLASITAPCWSTGHSVLPHFFGIDLWTTFVWHFKNDSFPPTRYVGPTAWFQTSIVFRRQSLMWSVPSPFSLEAPFCSLSASLLGPCWARLAVYYSLWNNTPIQGCRGLQWLPMILAHGLICATMLRTTPKPLKESAPAALQTITCWRWNFDVQQCWGTSPSEVMTTIRFFVPR